MNIQKIDKYFSFMAVFFLLFSPICLLAKNVMPGFNRFGTLFIMGVSGLSVVLLLLSKSKVTNTITLRSVFIGVLMYGSMVVYNGHYQIASIMENFIVWGIIALTIMLQDFDKKLFFNISMVLSSITIVSDLIYNRELSMYEAMTWTYSIFPCIAILLAHLYVYGRTTSNWLKIFYIPLFIMFPTFIAEANRGGLVSIVILFYFLMIKSINKKDMSVRNKWIINIILLTGMLLGLAYYREIIKFMYNFLQARHIDNYAITKMYRGILDDNITNNRDDLYLFAWNGFKDSPIWGNGIGAFHVKHGGWPHNLFLQILYEGGFILFLTVLVPAIKIIIFFVTNNKITSEEYGIFVILCAMSFPKLMFSSEIWDTPAFWLLFAFGQVVMANSRASKDEKKEALIETGEEK